jgi:hypothetical protein
MMWSVLMEKRGEEWGNLSNTWCLGLLWMTRTTSLSQKSGISDYTRSLPTAPWERDLMGTVDFKELSSIPTGESLFTLSNTPWWRSRAQVLHHRALSRFLKYRSCHLPWVVTMSHYWKTPRVWMSLLYAPMALLHPASSPWLPKLFVLWIRTRTHEPKACPVRTR